MLRLLALTDVLGKLNVRSKPCSCDYQERIGSAAVCTPDLAIAAPTRPKHPQGQSCLGHYSRRAATMRFLPEVVQRK